MHVPENTFDSPIIIKALLARTVTLAGEDVGPVIVWVVDVFCWDFNAAKIVRCSGSNGDTGRPTLVPGITVFKRMVSWFHIGDGAGSTSLKLVVKIHFSTGR